MGLFNFKKKDNEETTSEMPRNPSAMAMVRLVAVGYVLWTLVDLIKAYNAGGEEAPSLTLIICAAAVFLAGSAWIVWMTIKQYKQMQAENEAIAEAARLEELAAAKAEEPEEDWEEDSLEETEE